MLLKKSQIFGQIFIYILAIIIFSLILLYGYKTVKSFGKKADDVTMIQLITELKTSVKKVKGDYGTIRKKELSIPGVYSYVCFLDLDYSGQASSNDICMSGTLDYHPAVCNSWQDQAQSNMFLITSKEEIVAHYVAGIEIDSKYDCMEVKQGKIVLRLEGLGNAVKLSEWPS